jgi:hypothetical protein
MTGLPTILELVCFPHVIFGTWFINVLGNFFLVNPYSLHPLFICHAQGSGVHRRHNTPWLPHCGCQNPKKSPKRKLTTAKAHLLQSQTPHASPGKSPRNAGRPHPHMPYNVGSGTEGTWDGFSEKKKSKGKVSNHRHLNPCQSHLVVWQCFADTE